MQLCFRNLCKLRALLEKWVEEADSNKDLQELCKAETLVQTHKRKLTSIEACVRGNLENMFLQCWDPTPKQITIISKQLGGEGVQDVCVRAPPRGTHLLTAIPLSLLLAQHP